MIALLAPTFDLAGHCVLHTRVSNQYQAERRGTVTATLDGASAVYDAGLSVSDQTWTATVRNPSRALLVQLNYLVSYYAELICCCELGAFAVRVSFACKGAALTLSIRPLRRLSS